jgi:hypothetical protein
LKRRHCACPAADTIGENVLDAYEAVITALDNLNSSLFS